MSLTKLWVVFDEDDETVGDHCQPRLLLWERSDLTVPPRI
jgi:hypothetical protein